MNTQYDYKISVCLCTYKRPNKLAQCLESLLHQTFAQTFEVIVTDNDCEHSGEKIVEQAKKAFQNKGISLLYLVEPVQNIALARNRSLQPARGELVAFIDDDEHASTCWLRNLYNRLLDTNADGVWGEVIPYIPESLPYWMRQSKLFYQPNLKQGAIMREGLRTGNALIKRKLLTMRTGPFDEALGRTGGSDSDLFIWLQKQGFKFVWAANAEVFEKLEEKRGYLRWHLRRAYRGGWGYSRRVVKRYGARKGFILSVIRIIPSTLKALRCAIMNCNNIRYAGLVLLCNIVTNLGKCGYFVDIKIEEYKG
ncbi:glycosyltransferase family 2 protein [Candidatus Omnitrophota bacterium]